MNSTLFADPLISGCSNAATTSLPGTTREMLGAMRATALSLKFLQEASDRRFNLIAQYDPCPICRTAMHADNGIIYVCRHQWDEIQRKIPEAKTTLSGLLSDPCLRLEGRLDGIRIEIREAENPATKS